MKFYLIDAESDEYFVGKIERDSESIIPPLAMLPIGATYWNPENPNFGWERYE